VIYVVGYSGQVTPSGPADTLTRAAIAAPASLLVADTDQPDAGATPARAATTDTAAAAAEITVALAPATTTTRLGYNDHSDHSPFTQDTGGTVNGYAIPLPGGALLTVSPAGIAGWSYTNPHGDVVAATDNTGKRTWLSVVGPYGETGLSYQPNNTAMAGAKWGYLGGPQRLTDGPITLMGARAYEATLGRFTTVDPIEGGCANDYTYVDGDPINNADVNGEGFGWHTVVGWAKDVYCFVKTHAVSIAGVVLGAAGVLTAVLGGPVGIAVSASILSEALSLYSVHTSCRKGGDNLNCALGVVGGLLGLAGIPASAVSPATLAEASEELAGYVSGVSGGISGISGLVSLASAPHEKKQC
jgi:RHS repeat-associated protein